MRVWGVVIGLAEIQNESAPHDGGYSAREGSGNGKIFRFERYPGYSRDNICRKSTA